MPRLTGILKLTGLVAGSVPLAALAWSLLDMGGNASLIRSELAEQRHLQLGLLCLVLLVPLALTSFRKAREWMGLLHWLRLHRLVYAAAIGGVIHQAMVQKVLEWPTFLSASVLAVLLAYRIIGALRRRPGSAET